MSQMDGERPIDAAMAALQAGDYQRADTIMEEAVRKTRPRFFGGSATEHAAALFDQGQIRSAAGDYAAAARSFRAAAEVPQPGEAGKKEQLTYLRIYGETLIRVGDLDGAELALRDGLDRRRAFYGPGHAGYAFGLEPLAELLWKRGETGEASSLAAEALHILGGEGNAQYASVLALFAFIQADLGCPLLHGPDREPEAQLGVPDELIDELVRGVFKQSTFAAPAIAARVVQDLRAGMEARFGPRHPWMPHILNHLANVARQAAEGEDVPDAREFHAARIEALETLAARFAEDGDIDQAHRADQALSLAYDAAGRADDSEAALRRALDRARSLGDPGRVAGVLRNLGIFLAHRDRRDEAEPIFREAIERSRQAGEAEPIGRALVALGILLQHAGRFDEAHVLLEEAIGHLPTGHPDAFSARSHLTAIADGQSCGCGDTSGALDAILREMVVPHVPPGLLESIHAEPSGNLQVKLAREPTRAEMETLNRVIERARIEIRRRIEGAGFT